MPWSIRNYNSFIRNSRKEHGISIRAARVYYRSGSRKLKRSLYGADVKRLLAKGIFPRGRGPAPPKGILRERVGRAEEIEARAAPRETPSPPRSIRDEWDDLDFEDSWDSEDESSADYKGDE